MHANHSVYEIAICPPKRYYFPVCLIWLINMLSRQSFDRLVLYTIYCPDMYEHDVISRLFHQHIEYTWLTNNTCLMILLSWSTSMSCCINNMSYCLNILSWDNKLLTMRIKLIWLSTSHTHDKRQFHECFYLDDKNNVNIIYPLFSILLIQKVTQLNSWHL